MKLKLKSILPNPFRDLKTNPLLEEKIADLMGSINLTGFWENVVVRKNTEGNYELSYGHHRLEAAIRSGITEADFIVKKFDDAKMIQVMDNENRETYGSTPQSLIESVKAVVQSLAKGTIPAFEIDPKGRKDTIRYAPSYAPGDHVSQDVRHIPYTAMHIAIFLGRTRQNGRGSTQADSGVVAALDALFLKEKGRFFDSMLKKKDETGEIVPITMNELRKRTSEIKKDYQRVEVRAEKTKEEIAEFDAEQRRIQQQQKEAERKAEEARQKLVKQIADAKKEEDDKRAKELRERLDEKDAAAKKQAETFLVKQIALDVKIAQTKQEEIEARKEDVYLPIRREVERILHKLEGTTATGREALAEEVKALARQPLHNLDRERLRQAALTMGEWYTYWVAMQFLPPLSGKKAISEYRNREAARQRAEEAKRRAEENKKEKSK